MDPHPKRSDVSHHNVANADIGSPLEPHVLSDDRVNDVNVQSESSSGNAPLRGSYASATCVNRVLDDVLPFTGQNVSQNRPLFNLVRFCLRVIYEMLIWTILM